MRTSTVRGAAVLSAALAVLAAGALTTPARAAVLTPPAPSAPTVETTAATRDPLQWPFAATSIWNTPLGTRARYVPARLGGSGFGVQVDWFVVTRARDPLVPVYLPGPAPGNRCRGTIAPRSRVARRQHLPRSLVIPDAGTSVFVQPDLRTIATYGVAARCAPGGPLYGRWSGSASLDGDGLAGGHGASGISGIGGTIRAGELTGRAPIRHALKIALSPGELFVDAATGGKRWPAPLAGADAFQRYAGSVTALRMGALLALPPSATAAMLGVRSVAGQKLLAALRDYGGYVVDDNAVDGFDLYVEHRAMTDYRRRTGDAIDADPGLGADLGRIIAALAVVDDNGPSSIGGRGARRAAWAPPLRPAPTTGGTVPAATPSPTPVAVTAPPASAISARQVAEIEDAGHASASTLWASAVAAVGLLALGLWGGRRLAGGRPPGRRET